MIRHYAVGVVVFGVAIGFTRLLSTDYFFPTLLSGVVTHVIEAVVAIGLVVMMYRTREGLEFSGLWLFVLVVIASGLLVLEFTTGVAHALANAAFSAAQMLSYTFLLLAITDVSQRCRRPSDVVLGLGYPMYSLPMALVSLGTSPFTWGDPGLALLVIYILLVSVCLFIRRSPGARPALFVGLAAEPVASSNTLPSQLERMACAYDLTERECDVARLYAQGRSRAFIAGELCISENTVRDHVSHIYKKMKVHNKQEFIDVFQR